MTDRAGALNLLRRALGDPKASFRDGQYEAIDAVANKRERLLVVQRTGWGKSSVYFIATRILRDRGRGPTLIVSPLLALMRNQIEAAERLGIRAVTINSTNEPQWPGLVRNILSDRADAILISPERLANETFLQKVLLPISGRIGMLVVDEAHCISDWGHDFRPDYRRLINVLRQMPDGMPVLCTTATANDRVIADVRSQLGNISVQRGPLMRSSLALQTLRLPTQAARLAWLSENIRSLPGTGIIYTLTKRDAEQVATWLNLNGHKAAAYYSGVTRAGFPDSDAYRQHLEDQLLGNNLKALVATAALGMGYDKPDLGFVVHYQAPGSIVAYYQQVGRAGRAIDYAAGVLLSGTEDEAIHVFFRRAAFPHEKWVLMVLRALEDSDGLTSRELEEKVNLRLGQIEQVLKYLSVSTPAPVMKEDSRWQRTPVPFQMDHDSIRRLTAQRETEWREIQSYIDEKGCLMAFLGHALDDPDAQPCGKCSSCLGRPIVPSEVSRQGAVTAARFLRHAELPLECPKQAADGAFTQYGFRGNLPHNLRAEAGRILSRWGDAGWGSAVADDKHNGRFRDELVEAVAEMVRQRWKPQPAPTWMTCIPSQNHPHLVPDFAKRLAVKLGVPFVPAIKKIRNNEPQKGQQNRFHQCRNLDGVFAIDGKIPSGPVYLIDDVVDSGWTITVAAALLRQAGGGPVWPIALTTSSIGG